MSNQEIKPTVNPLTRSSATAKRAQVFAIAAFALAIIAAVIMFLIWQQQTQLQSNLEDKRVKSAAAVTVLQTQFTDMQKSQTANVLAIGKIEQLLSSSQQAQQMYQISYLVNLANLNLTINRDPKNASRLLKLALVRLDRINDPALFNLKKTITDDLTALKNVPQVNPENMILRLDQINQLVQALDIKPTQKFHAPVKSKEDVSKLPWYKKMQQGLSGLKDLVIIRHIDKPIVPLITPTQQAYLKENIQTKLQLAQWAIINRKEKLYQESIATVITWINQYFHNGSKTAPITGELKALQKIMVNPSLPDLANSLNSISRFLKQSVEPTSQPKTIEKTKPNEAAKKTANKGAKA